MKFISSQKWIIKLFFPSFQTSRWPRTFYVLDDDFIKKRIDILKKEYTLPFTRRFTENIDQKKNAFGIFPLNSYSLKIFMLDSTSPSLIQCLSLWLNSCHNLEGFQSPLKMLTLQLNLEMPRFSQHEWTSSFYFSNISLMANPWKFDMAKTIFKSSESSHWPQPANLPYFPWIHSIYT